jgi:hypothetical protein
MFPDGSIEVQRLKRIPWQVPHQTSIALPRRSITVWDNISPICDIIMAPNTGRLLGTELNVVNCYV